MWTPCISGGCRPILKERRISRPLYSTFYVLSFECQPLGHHQWRRKQLGFGLAKKPRSKIEKKYGSPDKNYIATPIVCGELHFNCGK